MSEFVRHQERLFEPCSPFLVKYECVFGKEYRTATI